MIPEAQWKGWAHPSVPKEPARQHGLFGGGEAKHLPLWSPLYSPEKPLAPARVRARTCTACDLHEKAKTVCMAPVDRHTDLGDKENRWALVILGTPTDDEDKSGQPLSGVVGRYVQRMVEKEWSYNVRYTYAVGCASGKGADDKHFTACLPHVWADWDRVKPERVLLLGYVALKALTGRYVDTTKLRRTVAFVRGVPAFPLLDPTAGGRNQFHKRQFEADLRWSLNCEAPKTPQGDVTVLTTGAEVEAYLAALDPNLPTSIDVENAGSLWQKDYRLLCIGMCQDPEHPVVIKTKAAHEARDALCRWLADPRIPKINQQITYDRQVIYREFGVDLRGVEGDTYIWSRLYEPEAKAGLKAQAWYVGFGGYKEEAKEGTGAAADDDEHNHMERMAPDDLHRYNGRDTSITVRLYNRQRPKMGKLLGTWRRLVWPAFDALAVVERNGMLLSDISVRAYDRWLEEREHQLTTKLNAVPGVPAGFNPGSPQQKAALLYDVLKLPAPKDRNVQADTLEELEHPIIPVLIELSKVTKQRSTYGLSMLEKVSPLDGRIHTSFDIVRTGRLSSHNPNMQNITKPRKKDDDGSWARGCFVAPPGHKLVALDYSQMELRVAAMLSNDKVMAAAFESGIDFHTMTAAGAYKVDPKDVTTDQRQGGKSLNFAIVFGKTDYGIAMDLDIPKVEAQRLMGNLLDSYQDLSNWRRNQIAIGETTGEIWCVWDPPGSGLNWVHRRGVEDIAFAPQNKAADKVRKHWRNVCLNTPIQNVANCFALASVAEAVNWCIEVCPQVRVVMTVHDEILLEVPDALVVETALAVRRIMLSWPSGCVRLKVDATVGNDWGHMTHLDLPPAPA